MPSELKKNKNQLCCQNRVHKAFTPIYTCLFRWNGAEAVFPTDEQVQVFIGRTDDGKLRMQNTWVT
uniref:Uncharacterized protein n=1 Tax=Romanomermis culicivorax TaxID=13658 RepID=A0A915JZN3_ROMCU